MLPLVTLPVAARLRRLERRLVARFLDAGADTPSRAILANVDGVLARLVHDRLRRACVLLPASKDRFYLDRAAYDAFRQRRRRRAAILLLAALAIGAVVLSQRS